ncbi:MAG: alkyl hydroperoxide reductase subunit F, partial [Burkholderiaceae bacterium]
MLDATLKQQLKTYLDRLVDPIELSFSADASAQSGKLATLLAEIAELSNKITVVERPHVRTPSFGIAKDGETPRVRFAGIPLGHEFTSRVLALLQVSGYPPKVETETADAIRALEGP